MHLTRFFVTLVNFFSSSGKIKAAKAAATVLSNMFQYKKLHRTYRLVRMTEKELCVTDDRAAKKNKEMFHISKILKRSCRPKFARCKVLIQEKDKRYSKVKHVQLIVCTFLQYPLFH